MNTPALSTAKRSRWMDWKPKLCATADSAESEPTKPSKPVSSSQSDGSVGFVGATPGEFSKIDKGRVTPWAEWKAAALNRLFQEQGVTGQPGRITAATVRHGERNPGLRG
jgi:hypothetical protein